jgi:hypothetical protein
VPESRLIVVLPLSRTRGIVGSPIRPLLQRRSGLGRGGAYHAFALALAAAIAITPSVAWSGPLSPALPPSGGEGVSSKAYLSGLITAARARHLSDALAWRRLVHYRSKLLGGVESDADGPAFFLAPAGKTDPQAELEATLAGFFAPPVDAKEQHPQCQFPARLAWLSGELGIDRTRLPSPDCRRLDEFRGRIQARSVTVVFSAYYLNTPASAFGHTFLRLNKTTAAEGAKHFQLMDFGAGYAATVDTSNPLAYLVRGLSGQFKGQWTHYAYFYKVREYADYESRDLWEYDLRLTPAETELLVAHLWELGSTWFDYYYLTENCSQGVLAALEAAAPRLELLRHLGVIVLPADTVKALFENPGLVGAVHFRPSIRTQFLARTGALSGRERDALDDLIASPAAPMPALTPPEQARALDAALDWVDYVHAKDLLTAKVTPAAEVKQRLMERRSAVPVQSDELVVPPAVSQEPELGHGSVRMGAAAGASTRSGPLAVYDFRLALHDLADPPDGYPALAQIEFFPVRVRYEPRHDALHLERAMLVDVFSLSDFSRFDPHTTWRAGIGADTLRDAGCPGCLAGVAQLGGGLARTLRGDAATAYALIDAELAGAPELHGLDGRFVRMAVGPSAGLRLRAGARASLIGEAGWRWLPWATPRSTFDLRVAGRLHFRRASLWVEAARWPMETQALVGVSIFL